MHTIPLFAMVSQNACEEVSSAYAEGTRGHSSAGLGVSNLRTRVPLTSACSTALSMCWVLHWERPVPSVANWDLLLILLQTVNASEPIVLFSVGSVRQLGSACRALFAPQRSLKLHSLALTLLSLLHAKRTFRHVSRTGRCSPASARVDVRTFAGSSTPSMPHPSHLGESTPFLRPPSTAATLQVWLARQCSGASLARWDTVLTASPMWIVTVPSVWSVGQRMLAAPSWRACSPGAHRWTLVLSGSQGTSPRYSW